MSSFFSSQENTPSVSTVADPYAQVRNPLVSWLGQSVGQPGPSYSGQMVAPTTDAQNQSADTLQQYANRTNSPTYNSGESEINNTINGNYDPSTSPYYQAIKAQSAQNLTNTNKQIENQTAGGGQYYSGARVQAQGQAATSEANNLNSTLGALQQQNTALKAQLTPYALQAGTQDTNAPLATTAALQQYGGLQQAYQQALDTANYQNWQSSNIQYPLSIAQIAAGVQQPPVYGQNSYSASPFSQIANGPLGSIAATQIAGAFSPSQAPQTSYSNNTAPYSPQSFLNGPVSLSGY